MRSSSLPRRLRRQGPRNHQYRQSGARGALLPTIQNSVARAALHGVTKKADGFSGKSAHTSNRINTREVAEEVLVDGWPLNMGRCASHAGPMADFVRQGQRPASSTRSHHVSPAIRPVWPLPLAAKISYLSGQPARCYETENCASIPPMRSNPSLWWGGPAGSVSGHHRAERGHSHDLLTAHQEIGGS